MNAALRDLRRFLALLFIGVVVGSVGTFGAFWWVYEATR